MFLDGALDDVFPLVVSAVPIYPVETLHQSAGGRTRREFRLPLFCGRAPDVGFVADGGRPAFAFRLLGRRLPE